MGSGEELLEVLFIYSASDVVQQLLHEHQFDVVCDVTNLAVPQGEPLGIRISAAKLAETFEYFTSPDQLGGQVITSLNREIKNSPRTGWVRGDKAMTVETEREILDLRERLTRAEQERESAQKALIENTSALAQGADRVEIPLLVTGYGEDYSDKKREELHATTTWDAMFADIGPVMINEATDRVVRDRVRDHLTSGNCNIPKAELAKVKGWKQRDIKVFNDDWDQIQVQYRALGLIDKGLRKRTASDTHKYLALTEKGDRHLAFLRAIRRDTDEVSNSPALEGN
jgi:hypothetical protein